MGKDFKHHPNEPGNPKRDILEHINYEEALEQSKLHCSKHNKKRVQICGELVCSLCDEEWYEMLEPREKLEKAEKYIEEIGQLDPRERKHPQADEMRIRPEEAPITFYPITKLEYFAMHAPPVPDWFEPSIGDLAGDYGERIRQKDMIKSSMWPWHWAELVLKARPKKPVAVSEEEVEGIAKGLASKLESKLEDKLESEPKPMSGEWESRP